MVISVVIEGAWRQQSDLIEVCLHQAAIGHANDYTPEAPRDSDRYSTSLRRIIRYPFVSTFCWNHMNDRITESVRESYDGLAEEYARRIFNELQHKPLDPDLLDRELLESLRR
jgi:hypothetical protein